MAMQGMVYVQKAGFITASKCKQVYTSQGTVEKNIGKNIDVSSLVNNIVQPKIPHIKEQKQHHKELLEIGECSMKTVLIMHISELKDTIPNLKQETIARSKSQ